MRPPPGRRSGPSGQEPAAVGTAAKAFDQSSVPRQLTWWQKLTIDQKLHRNTLARAAWPAIQRAASDAASGYERVARCDLAHGRPAAELCTNIERARAYAHREIDRQFDTIQGEIARATPLATVTSLASWRRDRFASPAGGESA